MDETQSCVSFTSNCDGAYTALIIGTRKDKDAMHRWNGAEKYKTDTSI